jgi:voltage-gated potassium channel
MGLMDQLRRRILWIVAAMAATLGVGTVGFVWIEHYPVFDAFYMTLITVTTVGYGEVHPLSQAGREFNSFVILFGVIIMLLAIGAMTQIVIELELNQFFGKRRIKNMIDKLEGHIILCGFGRVGRGAADELLRTGAKFVIVDKSEDLIERAIKAGMLGVMADASSDETLRDVGIARAKGLIATLASDADNLFLVLSAKTLNPKLALSARASEESSSEKMRRAGADFVFAPYDTTGHRMAQAMLKPHVQQFIDFATGQNLADNMGIGNVGIEQVLVGEKSPAAGRSLAEMPIRRETGVIVLAIRKASGEMAFNPPAEARLTGGDHLIAMGAAEGLRKLEQLLKGGPA